jgi:hypothetical protein
MAAPFVITSPTNTVLLGTDRTGQAAFTVSNQTGRAVRARASVAALDPTQVGWLAVTGLSERDYPTGGTEQITVTVTVPPDVAGGLYPFRLDVTSVVNPDEDWAQGPVVAFQVPPVKDRPRPIERRGYLETLLGAYVGGLGLGAIISGLLLLLFGQFSSTPGIVGVIAMWIGSVVGAYVALRIRGFAEPRRTMIPLAIMFPFAALVIMLGTALFGSPIVTIIGAILTVTVAALGARAFARWRATGGL